MVDRRVPGLSGRREEDVFEKLRGEILAARLKVTLDQRLDRKTSPTVKHLSRMKLPPVSRQHYVSSAAQGEAWDAADFVDGER